MAYKKKIKENDNFNSIKIKIKEFNEENRWESREKQSLNCKQK